MKETGEQVSGVTVLQAQREQPVQRSGGRKVPGCYRDSEEASAAGAE